MKLKYLAFLIVTVLILHTASAMWSAYLENDRLHKDLIGQKEKYEQLSENTAKLEIQYTEQKQLHEKAKAEWAEVEKKKNERIKLLSDATYLIGSHVERQNGPDYYYTTPRATKNYILNELRLEGKTSPPIGYIMIKNDGRTYKKNYEFEIIVKNLQTIDEETGRIKFYAKAFLKQKEVSPLNKRIENYRDFTKELYPLKITGGTTFYDPTLKNPNGESFMWTTSYNGGFNIGSSSEELFTGALGVSFAGYGSHETNLRYKLLQLGVGIDSYANFSDIHFVPVSFRPFSKIFRNTYIGPGIGYSDSGTIFFLNTSIGF